MPFYQNERTATALKVLTLSHMFPTPGAGTQGVFIIEQMKALHKLGIEMKAIAPTPWAPRALNFLPNVKKYTCIPKSANVEGMHVTYPRLIAFPGGRLFFLYGLFCYLACRHIVRKHVQEGGIDLIHAHTIMPDGFAAVLLGEEFDMPVVCTVHGSDISIYPHESRATLLVTKWALRRIKHLIAVSQDLRKKVDLLIGSKQVTIVRNGADEELFRPNAKSAARALLGLPGKAKIVLFIGNLLPVKGPEYLLRAVSQLSSPDVFLYIVGDGMLLDSLRVQAEQLGISARCVFVGTRPHEEIASWLSAADCLVLSSISEGFPTIIPEAMMCRIPVVATAVGGIPEVVKHRSTGLLVRPQDPASLGEAICSALQNDTDIRMMVDRAEEAVRAELTWEANARKTAGVYREAIAERTSS
jgi:teichuronic acid biosynthesis glycosyltransferase TuaC